MIWKPCCQTFRNSLPASTRSIPSDRILATVLFLDIASSTERAAELGDTPWRSLLNSYYAVVRKELARFRGKETHTTGDSFSRPSTVRRERCAARSRLRSRSDNSV